MSDITNKIVSELYALKDEKYALYNRKFLKPEKGGYGQEDKLLGIKVPLIRMTALKYYKLITIDDMNELISNEYHEIRFFALIVAILKSKSNLEKQVDFYLSNLKHINNWDLVDVSASVIIGRYVFLNNKKDILYDLSNTNHLWSERVSIVSSHFLIKNNDFEVTFKLCEKFINHEHHLMHKACGWMLREVGKVDLSALKSFLDIHSKKMPRVMLRYSLEKMDKDTKAHYMKKD